jgi:hypothetical protein
MEKSQSSATAKSRRKDARRHDGHQPRAVRPERVRSRQGDTWREPACEYSMHTPSDAGEGPDRMLIEAVLAALTVGFLAGLLSFKVKSRWCPSCGAMTNDPARQPPATGATGSSGCHRGDVMLRNDLIDLLSRWDYETVAVNVNNGRIQAVEAFASTSSANISEGFFQLWILRGRLLISEATPAR